MSRAKTLVRPFTFAAALAVAAVWSNACNRQGEEGARAPGVVGSGQPSSAGGALPGGGERTCVSRFDKATCVHRANLVEQLTLDLWEFDRDGDERGVPIAIEALESGSPVVEAQALRLIGHFPRVDEGAGKAVLPFVLSPRVMVQRLAARVLERLDDPYAAVGKQYLHGHADTDVHPYTRDPARDAATWGWTAPPGMTRYPPADGIGSIGLMTDKPVDAVASDIAKGAPILDVDAYSKEVQGGMTDVAAEMQRLAADYQRTQDPSILRKMQEAAQSVSDGMAVFDLPNPADDVMRGAKFVIAERRGPRAVRIAMIYREPAFDKTVLLLGWDKRAYPAEPPLPPRYVPPSGDDDEGSE